MSENQADPKLVIDEDWKGKVEAEKRAAAAAKQEPPQAAPERGTDQEAAGRLPAASFPFLVSTLMAQAMTAMGQARDPVAGHAVVRPDVAKHYIDILAMLEEKTKGNLTSDESEFLAEVLHQLRILFVTVRGQQPPAAKG